MLDFVDDPAVAQLGEKAAWIGFGEVPLVRRLQVGIRQVGKGCSAESRLARLSRPGHRDEGVLDEQGLEPGSDLASDHVCHTISVGAN